MSRSPRGEGRGGKPEDLLRPVPDTGAGSNQHSLPKMVGLHGRPRCHRAVVVPSTQLLAQAIHSLRTMVELGGFEPPTSRLRIWRSPS